MDGVCRCRAGLDSVLTMTFPEEEGALLDWEDIRCLDDLGVEIGSHTMTHRRLSMLSPDDQHDEIQRSKEFA